MHRHIIVLLFYAATTYAAESTAPTPTTKTTIEPGQFVCRHCGTVVAHNRNWYADADESLAKSQRREPLLGPEGRTLRFANPHNVQHELALFRRVTDVVPQRQAHTKHSYFPKYFWRDLRCSTCGAHLGWVFESATLHQCTGDVIDAKVLVRRKQKTRQAHDAELKADRIEAEAEARATYEKYVLAAGGSQPELEERLRKERVALGLEDDEYDDYYDDEDSEYNTEEEPEQRSPQQIVDETLTKHGCLRVKRGWWTYELCHHSTVTQYHAKTADRRPSDVQPGNLGTYNPHADNIYASGSRHFIQHRYENGDICDETESPRLAEVHFYCCDSERDKEGLPYLKSVVEPAVCEYRLTACIPELCTLDEFSSLHKPCPKCGKRFAKSRMTNKQVEKHIAVCDGQLRQDEPPTKQKKERSKSLSESAKKHMQDKKSKAKAKEARELAARLRKEAEEEVFDEAAVREEVGLEALQQCERQMENAGMNGRFYGLLWDQLLHSESEELQWVADVRLVTSVTH